MQQSRLEYFSLILFFFKQLSMLRAKSVSEVIVNQKSSNGDKNLQFLGLNYNFTHSDCAKILSALKIFAQKENLLRY